ncbi:T9SS type A sorting domain-containing protein [Spirosoma taeanense]|uniref:T9SS type A sorting domain-containing protein n=1 Tax=Spirosoma taeanense TaxID=2735870 RepID=A0A6M5YBH2_9BACT|nr:right-handed parallel beta-helix repeat-containing protein [Spirosoma taeanense]QJW90601.1 T9SS type A sorting domain-containing protein [Spirosoma taeanense]
MRIFTALLWFAFAGSAWAQTDCNCTYTITKTGMYDGKSLKIAPGSTVCIKAGAYTYLRLNNFVGTPDKPIRFINCGGLVDVNYPTGSSTGIAFQGCRYFQITGTGDSRYEYGIRISKTGTNISGLNITNKSSDCEVDHVEVSNTGFAGIMIKTDPTCDVTTQRANFTMYNVKVHHNYVHDTKGEGLYIGNSFWNEGMGRTCSGKNVKVLPHNIIGLEIAYNRTENTGCEGIQYACAPESQVHHNTVYNSGIDPFDAYQDNGVQIGGGVSGRFYNNTIRQSKGIGLIVVGHLGPNYIYNNIITDSGDNGVFVDERANSLANVDIVLANNTINRAKGEGIKLYNETQNTYILNTAITGVGSNKYISTLNTKVRYTAQNNFTAAGGSDAGYVDAGADDYHTTSTSLLINRGQDLKRYGIVVDLEDVDRPKGGTYDIGVYENVAESNSGARKSVAARAELSETVVVRAFPSPCVDQLTVRLSNEEAITELSIVDGAGRTLTQHQPLAPAAEVTLPVNQLSSGVYLIRIGTGIRQYVGRFLKQ